MIFKDIFLPNKSSAIFFGKDTNGCTVTHVLVVFDLMKMWDMAVECGAAINIENKVGISAVFFSFTLKR